MKILVDKDALAKVLDEIAPIACRRTTLPILSTVLLSATATGATLTATDLEVRVTKRLDCTVVEAGATLLPCRTVTEWVGDCGEGEMEIEATDSDVSMRIPGHGKLKLKTLPVDEYVPAPECKASTVGEVDWAPLNKILACRARLGKDMDMERFRHVSIIVEDGRIMACASDRRRLGLIAITPVSLGKFRGEMLVHGKAAEMLADAGTVTFLQSDKHLLFNQDGSEWLFAKPNDRPVPWKAMVEGLVALGGCTVVREELLEAVRGAHCLRQLEGHVRILIESGDDVMLLAAQTPEGAFSARVATGRLLPWEPVEAPSDHLLSFLNAAKDDTVVFTFSEQARPMKLQIGDTTFINSVFPPSRKSVTQEAPVNA